jgi:hypothetical protein
MTDKQKLYESACGFEDRLDSESEAERLRLYCDTHVKCSKGHHREWKKVDEPCGVCGSYVPFNVTDFPEAA